MTYKIFNGVDLEKSRNKWDNNYIWQVDNKLRNEAIKRGDMFYTRNQPCRKGHASKRYTVTDKCVECARIAKINYRLLNKDKVKKLKHKHNLKSLYGLTVEEYENLLKTQKGLCKICNNKLDLKKGTHIDHCHITKKVRGILCHWCNLGLGNFKNNPEFLRKAALYCEDV